MIKIILAAGQGNRLKRTLPEGYSYITKSLIKFNGESSINRLLKQVNFINGETIVVLGHESETVKKAINFEDIKIVINKSFKNDSNLKSLNKAINYVSRESLCTKEGILIIESDSYFQTNLLRDLISYLNSNKETLNKKNTICWTTKGLAKKSDSGGFIEPLENEQNQQNGYIFDIYISDTKKSNFTKKLYGLTWFNEKASKSWLKQAKHIIDSQRIQKPLYFHDVIFKNKDEYLMKYYDMSSKSLSFNDYKEYIACLNSN